MKRIFTGLMAAALCISLAACGGSSKAEEKTVPDLTGTWKQTNSASEDSYQEASISGDIIEINWVSDGGDTTSLYWYGTFEAPTVPGAYEWESVADHDKTDFALLASQDDTKVIHYEDGVLSYSASLMGTTTTVKLEKVE